MKEDVVAQMSKLPDHSPACALVEEVDLVVVCFDDEVSVFIGLCLHHGALMPDGYVRGDNLNCGVHDWDCRIGSGVPEYANDEASHKFQSWIERDDICVDAEEIGVWGQANPNPFDRDAFLGLFADKSHGTVEEPYTNLVQQNARDGSSRNGHHGVIDAMAVPNHALPDWDDIQLLTPHPNKTPLLDDETVGTDAVIGAITQKPLHLDIPPFVSHTSYGPLSEPTKVALARGAGLAGTGICSFEGGMLPEEQAAI